MTEPQLWTVLVIMAAATITQFVIIGWYLPRVLHQDFAGVRASLEALSDELNREHAQTE